MARRAAAVLVALLVACSTTEPEGVGLSTEAFIEIIVELRIADHQIGDRVAFERRKAEILDEHGATPQDLAAFVQRHGDDVAHLSAVWDTIEQRLTRTEPDSTTDTLSAEPTADADPG